jgi:hypothetical protein
MGAISQKIPSGNREDGFPLRLSIEDYRVVNQSYLFERE